MNKMSPQALKQDKATETKVIPLDEIFLSHDFNCRNEFVDQSCLKLAEDIAHRGLVQPITVRKLRLQDGPDYKNEQELYDMGFRYHIIAGHRRYTAYKLNKAVNIPCNVRPATMTEFECKDLNAIENLHRSQLSLAEECNSIKHYFDLNWDKGEVARKINKSYGWVQSRWMLLELPDQIMEWADKDEIKTMDVSKLYRYRDDPERLMLAARNTRENRIKEKQAKVSLAKPKDKYETKKPRKIKDIQVMMYMLQETFKDVEPEDLVKYGLIPEFIGRLPVVATLTELDEAALVQILSEPKNAITKQFSVLFGMEDVELEFRDDALRAIAHKAMKSKTGARGLRSMVEAAMLDIMYVIPEMKGLKKCIISEDTINTNSNPEFIYSDKKNAV